MGKRDMNLVYKVRTVLLERGHEEGLSHLDSADLVLNRHLSGGKFLNLLQLRFPHDRGSMNSTQGQGNMYKVPGTP